MSKHITKCKWCWYGSYSYKYGEWNCWHPEGKDFLTDSEAKKGCFRFKPNPYCPENVAMELGLLDELYERMSEIKRLELLSKQ